MGGRAVPRPRRTRRAVLERRAADAALYRPAGVARQAADLAGDAGARTARSQATHPSRPHPAPRRRRLPLPPPARPRRGLRRTAEGDTRRAARRVRALARAAWAVAR